VIPAGELEGLAQAHEIHSFSLLAAPDDRKPRRRHVVRRKDGQELVVLAQRPERQVGDLADPREER